MSYKFVNPSDEQDPRLLEAQSLVLHSRSRIRKYEEQIAKLKVELQIARVTIVAQEDKIKSLRHLCKKLYHKCVDLTPEIK